MEVQLQSFFDSYQQEAEMWKQEQFFDASEFMDTPLYLDFIDKKLHIINTTEFHGATQVNTAPAVSTEAGLELLNPSDIQANMALQKLRPVIFDTGASLAITGDKEDFIKDTYHEVTSMKLGGMASGATIAGCGNVVWTFACNNGDQLAVITKCYYVPSANARLLSPQK